MECPRYHLCSASPPGPKVRAESDAHLRVGSNATFTLCLPGKPFSPSALRGISSLPLCRRSPVTAHLHSPIRLIVKVYRNPLKSQGTGGGSRGVNASLRRFLIRICSYPAYSLAIMVIWAWALRPRCHRCPAHGATDRRCTHTGSEHRRLPTVPRRAGWRRGMSHLSGCS